LTAGQPPPNLPLIPQSIPTPTPSQGDYLIHPATSVHATIRPDRIEAALGAQGQAIRGHAHRGRVVHIEYGQIRADTALRLHVEAPDLLIAIRLDLLELVI